MINCAGLDIGGANIKFASTTGQTKQVPFAFWKDKDRFAEVLLQLESLIDVDTFIAVTMTAELADCFEEKKAGVEFVVNAVESVFGNRQDRRPLYYRTDGIMCAADLAIREFNLVSASNWHAIGWLAFLDSTENSGFVFDIGSTTTDIIPVRSGTPVVDEQDDLARLSNGQLFYGGIGRTPVCGLIDQVETVAGSVSTANELFATARDVFTWLNEISADENDFDSADGRSNSRLHAGQRLARMLCSDLSSVDDSLVDSVAQQTRGNLVAGITKSLLRVLGEHPEIPLNFVTFGAGAWLAEEIVGQVFANRDVESLPTVRSFSKSPLVNQTAAALAVAKKRQLLETQLASSNE